MKRKFGTWYLVLTNISNIEKDDIDTRIKKNSENISDQLASVHRTPLSYAMDFYSPSFWHIFVKELKNKNSALDIQLFFEDFERAYDVLLTVKNIDEDIIDEKSFIILELEDWSTRKLHARFFWAILPPHIKNPYIQEYTGSFQRLANLLADQNKIVQSQEY